MSGRAGGAFAAAVRDSRADLNNRFNVARHQFPALSGDDLLDFLRENVAPGAEAVAAVDPGATRDFVVAAYDAALLLCGQKLTGPAGRAAAIADGWREILPIAARHTARAPGRVIAAISNALYALSGSPGARPRDWIDGMRRVATPAADVEEFLRAGQVLAWLAGLAHLRPGALEVARGLPAALLPALFGTKTIDAAALSRLGADPWFDPRRPIAGPRVVREVGIFRGFGGEFLSPPRVAGSDDGWLVESAGEYWLLTADAFGATFHRADAHEWSAARRDPGLPRGAALVGDTLNVGSTRVELPLAGPVTSTAVAGAGLALTLAHTFSITLVALG